MMLLAISPSFAADTPQPPSALQLDPSLYKSVFAGDNVPDALKRAARALRSGLTHRTAQIIGRYLRDHPQAPLAHHARLLQAVAYDDMGHYRKAAPLYEAAADALPELADYCAYHGARAAWMYKDAERAQRLAARVDQEGRFGLKALHIHARALLKLKRITEAAAVIQAALQREPTTRHAGLKLLEARARIAAGDPEGAIPILSQLTRRFTHSKLGQQARHYRARALAKLRGRARRALSKPTLLDRVGDAQALYDRHRSDQAADLLVEIITDAKTEPRSYLFCEAYWLYARTLTKARRHGAAAQAYSAFAADCQGERVIEAIYAAARGLFNDGDHAGALRFLSQIWTDYPTHPLADDALYLAARVELNNDKPAEAQLTARHLIDAYPDSEWLNEARWLLVSSGAGSEPDSDDDQNRYTRGRIAYFTARDAEDNGQLDDAVRLYRGVAHASPMGYYALMAINRLAILEPAGLEDHMANMMQVTVAGPTVEPLDALRDPDFHEGLALLRIGLGAHAWDALRAVQRRLPNADGYKAQMSRVVAAAGHEALAEKIAKREIPHLEGFWPENVPELFRHVYPIKFRSSINRWAKARELDPALIMAVIREESHFNPSVESWANACGLMQMLIPTARDLSIAEGLGSQMSCARLLQPDLNIRLGTRFLLDLENRYGHHPGVVIAAYHAGYGNVARWLREFGDLPFDRWVEAIPFVQTREYIKRVLPAYWVYRWRLNAHSEHIADRIPWIPDAVPLKAQ